MMNRLLIYSLVLFLLAGSSCKKNFVNDSIVPPAGLPANNSSIRLYNIFGWDMDVTVNNIPLTSYSTDPNAAGVAQGLALFPKAVWSDGTSFTIPYTLLDKNGKAHISMAPRAVLNSTAIHLPQDTLLTDDPLHPTDYFVLSDGRFKTIPRSAAAPSKAYNFKLRVINLGADQDLNHLTGPVSVTYADGSAVDPKLTNVPVGAVTDYVEMPYATTQFKVYNYGNFTKQLSEFPLHPNFQGEGLKPSDDQEARFSPSRPFKPGGVYAILVIPIVYRYMDKFGGYEYVRLNGYRMISENSPSINYSFARMQWANVSTDASKGPLTLKVDGRQLGDPRAYGEHTDYDVFIQGDHQVQAFDKDGKLLVEKTLPLYANDNMAAWVYQKNDTPDICFSAMDMSSVGATMTLKIMNFCSGVPYLTVTNGLDLFGFVGYPPAYDSAAANIPLGQALTHDPYMHFDMTPIESWGPIVAPGAPYFTEIRAFSSNPGPPNEVPGAYLEGIRTVGPQDFIVNPAMYTSPLAAGEPGGYTLALIGKTGVQAPDPAAPRFLILKHTK